MRLCADLVIDIRGTYELRIEGRVLVERYAARQHGFRWARQAVEYPGGRVHQDARWA